MNETDILEQQAIDAAVNADWKQAIELNKKLLAIDKTSLDAHLRLGFAYLQMKAIKDAKTVYQKALKIQSRNQVALENLERITILEDKETHFAATENTKLDPKIFLEVTGKTKTVSLVNLGQKNHLAQLIVGQEVIIQFKKRKVEVRTKKGDYIGCLADDLSKRLIFFLKAKSKYRAYIQESALTRVVIFIQEESKGKAVANFTSFPNNNQSNMDQISRGEEGSETSEEEADSDSGDEDEIDKMASTLDRDEEFIDIHREPASDEEVEE
ncbi:MAG: hypothetical protein RI947_943 [Candidatus Parcubacteria bacterium]|jgi:tetratricopeptide (TPR) repeat protein